MVEETRCGWVFERFERLTADSGRRAGSVLFSVLPTWLLFPAPLLGGVRLLQVKRICIDFSGLESLALLWVWNMWKEAACSSLDTGVGSWTDRWDVLWLWVMLLSVNWKLFFCWVSWGHRCGGESGKTGGRKGWACLWAEKPPGCG